VITDHGFGPSGSHEGPEVFIHGRGHRDLIARERELLRLIAIRPSAAG
jgi:hypothetical protein